MAGVAMGMDRMTAEMKRNRVSRAALLLTVSGLALSGPGLAGAAHDDVREPAPPHRPTERRPGQQRGRGAIRRLTGQTSPCVNA